MDSHPINYLTTLQQCGNRYSLRKFYRSRFEKFKSFYFQDLVSHYGCVNAIEFSNEEGSLLASGGDDKRVLVWDVTKALLKPNYTPEKMTANHQSNIFCLAFDIKNLKLISSGNDGQVIQHDLNTLQWTEVLACENSVYGVSASPDNDHLVATACEDGTVHVIDSRLKKSQAVCLARCTSAFHSVMFNPAHHQLVGTANLQDGVALWDIRSPKKEVLHYGHCDGDRQRAMCARFNNAGTQLICLSRRLPLALFNLNDSECVAEFSNTGYSNSCTMKSCCFAGDRDQYVVSGSDDFGVYVWKLPNASEFGYHDKRPFKILRGHRSIVNQVRYNAPTNMLVSSGVEKLIKLWGTEPMPLGGGDPASDEHRARKRYSYKEYLRFVLDSGEDYYESENTNEDPRMLAFFDTLVQHEVYDRASDSSDSDRNTAFMVRGVSEPEHASVREHNSAMEEREVNRDRNHYFSTAVRQELSDSDSSNDEGPASLESLGILRHPLERSQITAKSGMIRKRLRSLRAQIKDEDCNWLRDSCLGSISEASDDDGNNASSGSQPPTGSKNGAMLDDTSPSGSETGPGVEQGASSSCMEKKLKRKVATPYHSSSEESETTGEQLAGRTRRKNARRRRGRKAFKSMHAEKDVPCTSQFNSVGVSDLLSSEQTQNNYVDDNNNINYDKSDTSKE